MDEGQAEVLDFWFRELTPQQWFADGKQMDPLMRDRFGDLHRQAVSGELDEWSATPLGRLALILLLDQFSRNIHRGSPQAFATDGKAQKLVLDGIDKGMDKKLTVSQRQFFYMPLMHAEDRQLQARSVECFAALNAALEDTLRFAEKHKEEVDRYGRFPHRNKAMGRANTAEEEEFIASTKDY